jgi:hypothetical protein
VVWADGERKIKWLVEGSVINGDFYSLTEARERLHSSQRRLSMDPIENSISIGKQSH